MVGKRWLGKVAGVGVGEANGGKAWTNNGTTRSRGNSAKGAFVLGKRKSKKGELKERETFRIGQETRFKPNIKQVLKFWVFSSLQFDESSVRTAFLLAMRGRRAFLTDIGVVSGLPQAQHVGPCCLATRAILAPLLKKRSIVLAAQHKIESWPEKSTLAQLNV